MARPKAEDPRSTFLNFRLTEQERSEIESRAAQLGMKSVSDYLRHLHHQAVLAESKKSGLTTERLKEQYPARGVRKFFKTQLGTIYCGDSLSYLFSVAEEKSVDLIMTSPPFGLVRKKTYGNEDSDRYCEWFRPFAEGFRRVLKDSGSLVIDIGGSWRPGTPTRSLYHFDLLVMLCREFNFHLCQEHYCWNPSRLPTPAEWVNVRRIRVKDAVNCVWWLSPSPWPRANNRRILAPYSDSMKDLLRNGYTAKLRPSGHDISTKFQFDNGGAVPPNLLAIANTESSGNYQHYCRERRLPIHPARYPSQLPEYFIRFLTNPDDTVVDPFAGSCVTGAVAEALGRRWVCVELSESYLQGGLSRFQRQNGAWKPKPVRYEIHSPCALDIDEKSISVMADGGKKRRIRQTSQAGEKS